MRINFRRYTDVKMIAMLAENKVASTAAMLKGSGQSRNTQKTVCSIDLTLFFTCYGKQSSLMVMKALYFYSFSKFHHPSSGQSSR
jgi:hypothetical protein